VPKRISSHNRMRDNCLGHKARCGRSPEALARPRDCHGVPMRHIAGGYAIRGRVPQVSGGERQANLKHLRRCATIEKKFFTAIFQSGRGRFLGR
jgi:hypothetical protein